jgi:hypothetical protein
MVMDAVKKYTVKLSDTISGTSLSIPIDLSFRYTDNTDLIDRDFVEPELDKSVNEIIDYGTVRLSPVNNGYIDLTSIKYKLQFNGNGLNYNDIGFVNDDLKYRRNNFKRSFLQLDFYDSKSMSNQNYLYSSSIYCRVIPSMFDDRNNLLDVSVIPVEFMLENPILNSNGISEGLYLYDYKTDIPKDIYMRASFNNAKTGKTTIFMTTSTGKGITELQNYLYTTYSLKLNSRRYVYQVSGGDTSYNNNDLTVNLYEANIV